MWRSRQPQIKFLLRVMNPIISRVRELGIELSIRCGLAAALGSGCRVSNQLSPEALTLPIYPALAGEDREALPNLFTDRESTFRDAVGSIV